MTKEQTYFFVNVLDVVARVYRVSPNEILGHRRHQNIAEARQMVYLLLSDKLDDEQIIKLMNRHITTVKVGRDKIRDMISLYADTRKKHKRITKKLKNDNKNDTAEAGSLAYLTNSSS
ncbi:helix-turn-helix domain-containing protein [Cyclobacterium marinum]|uniref:helix-turn-helix domain-containing protein n=1 Tax=Cyclobacterium marinum TaxID=104 RepID=UPI0005A52D40